jgi:hypothetical protein
MLLLLDFSNEPKCTNCIQVEYQLLSLFLCSLISDICHSRMNLEDVHLVSTRNFFQVFLQCWLYIALHWDIVISEDLQSVDILHQLLFVCFYSFLYIRT